GVFYFVPHEARLGLATFGPLPRSDLWDREWGFTLRLRLMVGGGMAIRTLLERLGQVGCVSVGFRRGHFLGDLHGHLREISLGFGHRNSFDLSVEVHLAP